MVSTNNNPEPSNGLSHHSFWTSVVEHQPTKPIGLRFDTPWALRTFFFVPRVTRVKTKAFNFGSNDMFNKEL